MKQIKEYCFFNEFEHQFYVKRVPTRSLNHLVNTVEQRCLLGTWTSPKIMKAMEKAYRVVKMYEIYQSPETTMYDHETNDGGLFEKEGGSSGLGCHREKKTGLWLSFVSIRSGANSAKTELDTNDVFFYDNQMDDFCQMLTDPTKQVLNFEIVNDHIVQVSWIHDNDFVDEDEYLLGHFHDILGPSENVRCSRPAQRKSVVPRHGFRHLYRKVECTDIITERLPRRFHRRIGGTLHRGIR
ncbi:unnamed protein product [Mytilus edulis]|uniref:Uncharacterized protein n=1 Tax=Mytilus edulis TaxID=6550 RepID=A0A8S3VPH1_MYTED|nr:unnamed protein product [Mytilus edulis]